MRTLRIRLPVLAAVEAKFRPGADGLCPSRAQDDEAQLLDLVTRVPGVVAVLVDEPAAVLEVVLSRHATALLVQQQVREMLWAGAAVTA